MFIEINRSYSFRKVSEYCLHDIGKETSDRVDFVETRNLATENPHAAWRIMASRTYLQHELKERAGVSLAGRKDGKPVGHMLVSWGKDEADAQNLDREGMVRSVEGALKAIGAEDRQAMIIAHNDTADRNPHCHVIINLIGDDGRLLKSYNDHKKLSRFALEEEIRIHGEPVVAERHKRWEDRAAGETPVPMKKKPRHQYELEKNRLTSNDNEAKVNALSEKQCKLEQTKAAVLARQQRNRERLREILQERERRLKNQSEALVRRAKSNARQLYDEPRRQLLSHQKDEREQFEANERTLYGSIENGLKLADWFSVFYRSRESGSHSIKDLFDTLTREGKRREVLLQNQEAVRTKLRKEQQQAEKEAERLAKAHYAQKLQEAREHYADQAKRMEERQSKQSLRLKAMQKLIHNERNALLKVQREKDFEQKQLQVMHQKLIREFEEAAKRESEKDESGSGDHEDTSQGQNRRRKRRERKPRDPSTSRRKRSMQHQDQLQGNHTADASDPPTEAKQDTSPHEKGSMPTFDW